MKLSAKAVRLAYAFAAEGDIRYYLNAVNIEPAPGGGALITATNGHRLAQIHDRDATNVEPMIISLAKGALAALRRGRWLSTEFDEKRIAVLNKDDMPIYLQVEGYQVEANYPDWRAVLGERESWERGNTANANVRYIAEIATLMNESGVNGMYERASGISFYSQKPTSDDGAGGKLLFILDGAIPAWGMVMPMRPTTPDPLNVAFGKAA